MQWRTRKTNGAKTSLQEIVSIHVHAEECNPEHLHCVAPCTTSRVAHRRPRPPVESCLVSPRRSVVKVLLRPHLEDE